MKMSKIYDIDRFPESMSTKTAAMYLGVSQQTVRNYITKGYLPTVKIGTKYMVPRTSIKKMIGIQ